MKTLIIAAFTIMILAASAKAQNDDKQAFKVMLVNAKIAGMCGTLKQLSAFQQATQMPGGNDFIVRFFNTEAARLGKNLQSLMGQCQNATKTHAEMMKLFQ